jgi:hypothetical protein
MARAIQFSLGQSSPGDDQGHQLATFELGSKIDKKALYGFAKRIAEKDGVTLSKGLLLSDGQVLPSRATSLVKADPLGSPAESVEELLDGAPALSKPSSLNQINPVEPVPLNTLAEFNVSDVYPLNGQSIAPGFAPGLYRTQFNYAASAQSNEALLLINDKGSYLLVGQTRAGTFLSLQVTYEFFDADDAAGDDEELDFSMI